MPSISPTGSGRDESLFPISFDVAPDGRFFVFDAGNERIQVVDLEGTHITEWGSAVDLLARTSDKSLYVSKL